jgi:hypothetical protein
MDGSNASNTILRRAMNLVTRKQWGARPPTCHTPLPSSQLTGIAVHYSAANSDEQISHWKCLERVRGIQNFHMSPAAGGGEGPWCDIAYNFLFCKHGYVFEGRGYETRSAAQGTNAGNDHYIAICFLGDDSKGRDDVTPAGRKALSDFINTTLARYGKRLTVKPHSFFHSTGCPGDELRAYIKLEGWKTETKVNPKWPFKNVPPGFWVWNDWRINGRPLGTPRPTGNGLPIYGSVKWAKYWYWARKYDAYVKAQKLT